jgi:Rab GDP dissociation inhibitor
MFVRDWKENEEKTHKGIKPTASSKDLLAKFKLEGGVVDVVGHALALYPDENWLDKPAKETITRIMLYAESLSQYGKSPYLYPVYGLGDLPQAFARLSAVHGGTYMLNKPILGLTFDESGRVTGVKSDDGVAKCKVVVGDPSYFTDRVKKVGTVGRCIAIMDHPIPGTSNSESCQIILPMSQIGRKSDVYISCVSFAHNVAPKGKYIALVATQLEKDNPQEELASGVKLLGPTLQTFYSISPLMEPSHDAAKEHIHISKSYDSSTHFESVCTDVIRMYQEITGEKDVSYIFVSKTEADE